MRYKLYLYWLYCALSGTLVGILCRGEPLSTFIVCIVPLAIFNATIAQILSNKGII
jgi:hypothetical protein